MKTYILHGKPIALKRARITKFGSYDPQRKEKGEHRALLYNQRGNIMPISEGPLELVVTFFMPIPKSTPKKKKLQDTFHFKRPDIDNLIKYILDVSQGVIITDDSLISTIIADKVYDKEPRTEFTIHKVE